VKQSITDMLSDLRDKQHDELTQEFSSWLKDNILAYLDERGIVVFFEFGNNTLDVEHVVPLIPLMKVAVKEYDPEWTDALLTTLKQCVSILEQEKDYVDTNPD
jgi:ribosomal protein S8